MHLSRVVLYCVSPEHDSTFVLLVLRFSLHKHEMLFFVLQELLMFSKCNEMGIFCCTKFYGQKKLNPFSAM